MITINDTDRVEFLKKQINTLEWDIPLIKDEDLLQRKQAQLNILRSELQGLRVQNNQEEIRKMATKKKKAANKAVKAEPAPAKKAKKKGKKQTR